MSAVPLDPSCVHSERFHPAGGGAQERCIAVAREVAAAVEATVREAIEPPASVADDALDDRVVCLWGDGVVTTRRAEMPSRIAEVVGAESPDSFRWTSVDVSNFQYMPLNEDTVVAFGELPATFIDHARGDATRSLPIISADVWVRDEEAANGWVYAWTLMSPSVPLGDNARSSARADSLPSPNGSRAPSVRDVAPVVHAELFVDRDGLDAPDPDAAAGEEVADEALAADAAYVADCVVPAERRKAWDFFSPGLVLRVPDGSVWAGWPSRAEFDDSGPNGTFAAMSAAFGARSLLNLEWSAMRDLQSPQCVPLDRNTVVLHFESVVSMVDHEAGGVHRHVRVLGSDTLVRDGQSRYGWVIAVRDYRHVEPYVTAATEGQS